jgi:hypothetical protein
MRRRGFLLLTAVLVLGISALLGSFLLKMVYNEYALSVALVERERARGGVEVAGEKIRENPGWFTDLPASPAERFNWLTGPARGEKIALGRGELKMVRELGSTTIYLLGVWQEARVGLRAEFSLPDGGLLKWREI